MNRRDPASRFSADAVRKFEDQSAGNGPSGGLSDLARQVAAQYGRDTMSPVMVTVVLRLIEFALLFLSGLALYVYFEGFFHNLGWQYALTFGSASLLAIVLLDIADCY